jgi:beta-galactosidase
MSLRASFCREIDRYLFLRCFNKLSGFMGIKLSKGFLFGFSTAGFQHEMGFAGSEYDSDWFRWVHDPENILASIVSGDMPENGPGYWDLFKSDHDMAWSLGMRAARIGIEWARIFPKPTIQVKVQVEEDADGVKRVVVEERDLRSLDELANRSAIERYRQILGDWKARGGFLIVNLYHWPLPLWIHDPIAMRKKGPEAAPPGWVSRSTVVEFAKYAAYIAWKLDDLVDMWSTMNEPNVVWSAGYFWIRSGFPPGYLDLRSMMNARKNLLEAHARAYENIKAYSKKPVGVIYAVSDVQPLRHDDAKVAEEYERFTTHYFFEALTRGVFDGLSRDYLKGKIDWIGINYYSRTVVTKRKVLEDYPEASVVPGHGFSCQPNSRSIDGRPTSDFGWEIYPEGLYNVLSKFRRLYGLPMMVTENGIADEKDLWRPWYIIAHMAQIARAVSEGADVRGYLHWNLIDNYEWASGFKMRFGLAYVDYASKKRYLRPSALVFREIATQYEIPDYLEHLTAPPRL